MVPVDELEELHDRSRRPARIALWLLGVALIGAIAYLAARPAPETSELRVLPAFDLPRLDRNGRLANADLEDTPIVINFWASWCGPCREEMPLFEEAWVDYRSEGVVVLGVNVQDQVEDARAFLDELGVTFPTVRDADQDLARALDLYGLPQTFFVRRDGTIVDTARGPTASPQQGRVVLGAISRSELRRAIEELLAEQPD